MTDAPALKPAVAIRLIDILSLASSTPVRSVLTPIFDVEFGAPLDGHNKTFIIAVTSRACARRER
jgi:hypothetical protein